MTVASLGLNKRDGIWKVLLGSSYTVPFVKIGVTVTNCTLTNMQRGSSQAVLRNTRESPLSSSENS